MDPTRLAGQRALYIDDSRAHAIMRGRVLALVEAPRWEPAESALRETFGYEAWVILVTVEELQGIVEAFPFSEGDAGKQPYVMFLADPKALDDLLSVQDQLDASVDRLQPGDGVLYWEVTKGETLNSVFGKHSAKPKFKALTTTRNMRTLRKLLP